MIKSKQSDLSLYLGGDMLAFVLIISITVYNFNDIISKDFDWYIVLSFFLIWLTIVYWKRLYLKNIYNGLSLKLTKYFKAYFFLVLAGVLFYSIVPLSISNSKIILVFLVGFPIIAIPMNFLLIFVANIYEKRIQDYTKYALIAGIGKLAKRVENQMHASKYKDYHIKGFINCNKEECLVSEDKVVSEINNIHLYLKENPVDEIIIALPYKRSKKIKNIVMAADYYGIRVKYIPDYQELFGNNYKSIRYGGFEAINVRQLPLDETLSFLIKNSFDKVFSLLALLLLSPVFMSLAILIKLDSPGPLFYCPIRIGKGGKPFKVFKFRSMRENDAVLGGSLSTQKDDPRITKLGRIMRKYSLDELPQFLNVLLGDMSVVGPRPHRSYLNQQLQESEDKYMIRHYFKPGITGWAQVNGWRGPTDTKEQKSQRTLHDIWYMENWSLQLDLKIIFMTIFDRKVHKSAF